MCSTWLILSNQLRLIQYRKDLKNCIDLTKSFNNNKCTPKVIELYVTFKYHHKEELCTLL